MVNLIKLKRKMIISNVLFVCADTRSCSVVGVSLVRLEVGLGVRRVRDVRVSAAGGARHGHLEGVGAGRHQADAAHARDGRGEAHRRETETYR